MRKPIVRVDYGCGWKFVDFPSVLWEKVNQELYDNRFTNEGSGNPQTVATVALLEEASKYFHGIKRCEVIDPDEYPEKIIPIMTARSY